tara:strand:+ start:1117 stop:2169 length:1053 start_codon:yes stop_codon:yes gene_type:complete
MSAMLEQAIVDAKALREAAIQSAEQAVLAKYSGQIKDTIETLLEQDEVKGESYGEDTVAPEDKDDKSIVEAQLDEYDGKAYAFGDLSDSNNFELEEDQVIEIDLEKIVAESNVSDEVAVSDEEIDKLVSEELENEQASLNEEENKEVEEEVIEEKMKLDFEATPAGWMNRGTKVLDEEAALDLLASAIAEMELELTKEHKETQKVLEVNLQKAENTLKKEQKENARLTNENEALYEAVESLKTKFDEMNLINAKLLYTNKVLSNGSLNERQKNEIVESIQSTDSVEKAKVVYETLQSAVGTPKTGPKSLSEAVGRRTNTSMLLKAQESQKSNNLQETFANRMKALAGIQK